MMDPELAVAIQSEEPADLIIRGGRVVNVYTGEIRSDDVAVIGEKIARVGEVDPLRDESTHVLDADGSYLVPGLVDGHIHVECSKLSMTRFAELVVPSGTTTVISGLDQILVVRGLEGVRDFLDEAWETPLKVFWGVPYKTPYTLPPSTVGYELTPEDHREAQNWDECVGIWETVQEFLYEQDEATLEAMRIADSNNLGIYGCAPYATGKNLATLSAMAIRADHESYSAEEMADKMRQGMYVMIRESSVAHFLEENSRVLTDFDLPSRRVAFCTDDVDAEDVLDHGHLDHLVREVIREGVDPIQAIQMASLNCAEIYGIDHLVGGIAPGRYADVLLVEDLEEFQIDRVVARGTPVAAGGHLSGDLSPPERDSSLLDTIRIDDLEEEDFVIRAGGVDSGEARVLSMEMSKDVPFVRTRREEVLPVEDGVIAPDPGKDVLYLACVERYGHGKPPALTFVSGFDLRAGAFATSASPDDNNVLCVGTNPRDMKRSVDTIRDMGGGQVVVKDGDVLASLDLPIGGIVSDLTPGEMAARERDLDRAVRSLGCDFTKPFMYLMFLSITAIPDYALTDRGLVEVESLNVIDPVLDLRS